MTIFFKILREQDKTDALLSLTKAVRAGINDSNIFQVQPDSFRYMPGAPFAYWAPRSIVNLFKSLSRFENDGRLARRTNGTTDDNRWIRTWWEVPDEASKEKRKWIAHAKGGAFSPYYSNLHLVISWDEEAQAYPGYLGTIHRPDIRPASLQHFFKPGLTWSRRNSTGLSFRILPKGAIFGDKGPGVFFEDFSVEKALSTCAILNSIAFRYLVSLQLGTVELAQSYEAGLSKIRHIQMLLKNFRLSLRKKPAVYGPLKVLSIAPMKHPTFLYCLVFCLSVIALSTRNLFMRRL